jgi:hypothetical protein
MKHTVRTRDGGTLEMHNYARWKAIRIHCTECMGFEENPSECTSFNCALYPYRARTRLAYNADVPETAPGRTVAS